MASKSKGNAQTQSKTQGKAKQQSDKQQAIDIGQAVKQFNKLQTKLSTPTAPTSSDKDSRHAWVITTDSRNLTPAQRKIREEAAHLAYFAVQPRIENQPRSPHQTLVLAPRNEWTPLLSNTGQYASTTSKQIQDLVKTTPDKCDLLIFIVGMPGLFMDRSSFREFLRDELQHKEKKNMKVSLFFWSSSMGSWYDNVPECKPWMDSFTPIVEGALGVGRFLPGDDIVTGINANGYDKLRNFCNHYEDKKEPRDPRIVGDVADSAKVLKEEVVHFTNAVRQNIAWGISSG